MSRKISERLLTERVTIKRPVQSLVPSTRRPVFQFQTIATAVKARLNPASTALNRNVLGQIPKRAFKLFLNPVDLKENDEVIRESDGEVFVVTEVKNLFGHHIEASIEEKKK
ncbi:MAG: hypothetical protein HYT79_02545 [Elusimicrobia bacterium]|nr:hypothetical protein [Elusimicrobiota bacterium]